MEKKYRESPTYSKQKSKGFNGTKYQGNSPIFSKKSSTDLGEEDHSNCIAFIVRFPDKERTIYYAKREVEKLAEDIGIDLEHDKANYMWFLQQILFSELPYGWQKELDPKGNTIYHNTITKTTTDQHPGVYKFRIAFNELLKAEAIKKALAQNEILPISNTEKLYIEAKINSLSIKEREKIHSKVREALNNDEEKATEELVNKLPICMTFKNKFCRAPE